MFCSCSEPTGSKEQRDKEKKKNDPEKSLEEPEEKKNEEEEAKDEEIKGAEGGNGKENTDMTTEIIFKLVEKGLLVASEEVLKSIQKKTSRSLLDL